ncbi:hypothetical protein [Crystallibacter degradans]|uniref:hypothetical protein n=1 Tax=Crystallibacter degradans TaxID=2726743 RepID=UPI00147302E7|nr:hypothetical protein [Arthrobacter sp. SF27]NMR32475.1 hypothetical protein [Arthrobacter sp. SF27]
MRRATKRLRTASVAAVLLACTACAGTGTGAGAAASAATPHTPEPTGAASASAGDSPHAPATVPVPANPAWLPGDEEAARETARASMRDFARPNEPAASWANDLALWLTPQATADYSAVDPATVPATRVTGDVELDTDQANGFGATATVPTDAGIYTLQLLRQGQDEPWKVNRLRPPG